MVQTSDRDHCACQMSLTVSSRQDSCSRGHAYIIGSGQNLRPSRRGVRPGNCDNENESTSVIAGWTAACSHRQSTQCWLSQQQHNRDWRAILLIYGQNILKLRYLINYQEGPLGSITVLRGRTYWPEFEMSNLRINCECWMCEETSLRSLSITTSDRRKCE